MNKSNQRIIFFIFALAGAILASLVMSYLTPNDSWLALAGWTIFFLAIQFPIMLSKTAWNDCLHWFSRLWRKS